MPPESLRSSIGGASPHTDPRRTVRKWQFHLQEAPSAASLAGLASTWGLESVLTLSPCANQPLDNEAVQGWKLEPQVTEPGILNEV